MNKLTIIKRTQLFVAVAGIVLPYLSRLPGVFMKGTIWFTTFFSFGVSGILFFQVFNAICWGSIVYAIGTYKNAWLAFFPVIFGFPLVALGYGCLDLASSSTAALALIFIPIETVPLVLIGWLIGKYFDRNISVMKRGSRLSDLNR